MTVKVSVSVVIPCYRCVQTIERAVSSVAAQTAKPMELILVDDGSADGTLSILSELRARYEPGWITLVALEQNVGAASARNAGWDAASGEYLAFLDADDSWHPRKIEVQHHFMASNPDVTVSGHGHEQVHDTPTFGPVDFPLFHRLSKLLVLLKNPFVTPSFMVRRDLPFHFQAGKRHMEDHYFLMQVSTAGLGIAKTSLPMAFIFKNLFGDAGLSADHWAMQRGELENYSRLSNDGRITPITAILLKTYSWLKFLRRLIIIRRRNLFS